MSEWLKEHAWKSTPPARADAHQIVPTHSPINNFRYNNLRRHLPVNDALRQGFRGVSDTDLTQNQIPFLGVSISTFQYALDSLHDDGSLVGNLAVQAFPGC